MTAFVARYGGRCSQWLAVFTMLCATGCSGGAASRAAIRGEVKLDGKPIQKGSILFVPADGTKGSTAGGPILSGHYQLPAAQGPAIGLNKVEIHASRGTGRMVPKAMAPVGEMEEERTEAVDARFNSATALTCTVKSGENTADFEVSSK